MTTENQLENAPEARIDCLRCSTRMRIAGPMALREFGSLQHMGVPPGNVHLIELEVLICPNCGKTEFFF